MRPWWAGEGTAAVYDTTDSGTPSGTVTFSEGTSTLGTATLDSTGTATFSSSTLAVGSDTITASYSGDVVYASSTDTETEEVNPIGTTPTTTAVTALPSPAVSGEAVTLTATVSDTTGSGTPSGTVTFSEGTSALGTATLDSTGTATLSTTALAVGNDTITASYGGDATYAISDGTVAETVDPVGTTATTTALTASPNPVVSSQPVTFTATVSGASGSNVPTGMVTFSQDGTTLGTAPLNSTGGATFSTSELNVGSDIVTATYGGDTTYASSSKSVTEEVKQATSTAITASPNPLVAGQSVTLTTTVSDTSGSGTPTGTVTFSNGSTTLGTATLNSSGTASFSTTALPVGNDTITASYSGDTTYAASTGTVTETVDQTGTTATTTSVTASPNPAVSGQTVALTATVSSSTGSAAPTGTVTFSQGSTILGTTTLDSAGTATVSTSALVVGSDTITASYGGDTTYAASSSTVTETVNPIGTTATSTALTASPNPGIFGQSVTLAATISHTTGSGVPSGTVTFSEGGTTLGTATLDSTGAASFSTTALSVGSDTFTASYSGDTTYAASSDTVTETVNQAPTSTALTASPNSAVSGQPVTFTATVSGTTGSGTPTGTVTFSEGSTTLGTATLNSSGAATLSSSTLAVGSDAITASYIGDATHAGSSGNVTETVNQVGTTATSTALTASPNPASSGQPVTLTATISHTAGSGAPTGTVTFSEGGTTLGTATLTSSGTATFSTSALSAGTDTITASYSGDTTYAASNGTGTETVNQVVPTGYTIKADVPLLTPDNAPYTGFSFANAMVGATYTYSAASSGGGTPVTGSGTVSSATQDVTGIDLASLPSGTVTFSVKLSNGAGAGATVTATTILNQAAPAGYTITADNNPVTAATASSTGFTFTGAEVVTTYQYTITSSGSVSTNAVTGSGKVTAANQNVTGINVSALADGTLTFSVTLTDTAGNTGIAKTTNADKTT